MDTLSSFGHKSARTLGFQLSCYIHVIFCKPRPSTLAPPRVRGSCLFIRRAKASRVKYCGIAGQAQARECEAAMTPSPFLQPVFDRFLNIDNHPSRLTLAVSIAILILYGVYQRIFHPLAKVPGPVVASLTRLWLGRQFRDLKMHRVEMALHHRYGSVVRIAPTEVSVSSPQAMQLLYGTFPFPT